MMTTDTDDKPTDKPTGYHEWWATVEDRVWHALPKRANKPITQGELADKASRATLQVTPRMVRAVHPRLEQRAQETGLYLNRPVYGTNTYSLSRYPFSASLSMIQRWRHVIGRITNDLDGGMLKALANCGDRDIERVAQRVLDTYLDLRNVHDRLKVDIDALVEVLREKVKA